MYFYFANEKEYFLVKSVDNGSERSAGIIKKTGELNPPADITMASYFLPFCG